MLLQNGQLLPQILWKSDPFSDELLRNEKYSPVKKNGQIDIEHSCKNLRARRAYSRDIWSSKEHFPQSSIRGGFKNPKIL